MGMQWDEEREQWYWEPDEEDVGQGLPGGRLGWRGPDTGEIYDAPAPSSGQGLADLANINPYGSPWSHATTVSDLPPPGEPGPYVPGGPGGYPDPATYTGAGGTRAAWDAARASSGAPGGGGPLLPGFGSQAEQDAWALAYLREHGNQPPSNWNRAAEERTASQIWANMHGNPASWGYGPTNTRVPNEIFQRIASARRSPDVGPQGPAAWAEAADRLGGAYLAARGINYHGTSVPTATGRGIDWSMLLSQMLNNSSFAPQLRRLGE